MTLIAAIGLAFKPVILPIITALMGWLIPSPAQLLAKKEASTHQAESTGQGLDKLP